MIVDGRVLANEVLARAKARARELSRVPRVLGIVANTTPATQSYLRIKEKRATDAGCVFEVQRFLEDTNADLLCRAIAATNADTVIVQLPLPSGIDTKKVCDAIPLEKDADVLSSVARTKFEHGDADALLPPVVAAVREIFIQYTIEVKGKSAVVIGNGWLVGNPCAVWLKQQGAEVSMVTLESGDLAAALSVADIVISGAGSPHLIKPDMIKEGVVLIDAGTSDSGGALAGDADPACAEKCALFTPVPGGVGPLAVACLFENAVTLTERAMNS
ncbi:MAG: bifunctional 5,10-methylenetetrahydrofolate dehydrogenase/5,10-methenyltetrahydrofolate cyclohydrolase [Candidatus Kaiserbacteria bacterium]|nr:bifunctional 5,10-methylenetetrahydrofolate dehydrogenase/5,10-methenyltetrahydrofolate cyclohydrolase [Candidatus Kaiserbacteria bacterium]